MQWVVMNGVYDLKHKDEAHQDLHHIKDIIKINKKGSWSRWNLEGHWIVCCMSTYGDCP